MNARSKSEIRETILNDLMVIHNRRVELSNRLRENLEDGLSYVRELAAQLSQPSFGPLVPKTPKMRKRAVQRIETIPEDEVFQQENLSPASSVLSVNEEERKDSEVVGRRTKRGASKRAADNIKKQSFILSNSVKKVKRDSQIKRKKSAASSSDEDNDRISKYSKVEESQTRRVTRKQSKQMIAQPMEPTEPVEEAKSKNTEEDNFESPVLRRSSRASSNTASFKSSQNREVNNVDDAIVAPNADDVEEPSMYEDAIGKPVPVMNSTLKHSLLPLNATVVLERLPQQPKLNETVVIQKAARNSKKSKEKESSKKTSQDVMQSYKAPAQYNDCDELITDDESSPEVKRPKKQLGRKQVNKKQVKGMLSTSSDDEIPNTPVKTRVRDATAPVVAQESKTTYKSNALFSPYAKESVKKRVEAFEQAVMHSPKPKVDVDAPTRITRTKTRAMATAEMETETKNAEKSVAQILARKSLVKAKRISLAKQKKNDEFKEVKESVNKEQLPERINKLLQIQTDKINVKQTQQLKTTPLSKLKLMQPTLSVNRLHTPLNTLNLSNYSKTLTASRANIITNMESLIPPPKSTTKTNSAENQLDEKRRPEEDARKKREEALRLQTEEKRRKRQEKELKNKLAREAKEKQELEKRQRAEREREEKAKLALAMQEKQREEMERKRLAQLQRAQEKEERRKLEEQQKLQRLQEQEETERSLAEQRRREQEAEKRREAEARAQQAAAEALRQKNQLLAAQAKHKQQANNKHQSATVSYVLDSEPDDDESDDESRPKHEIPHWAQAHVRRAQLAMQLHIPDAIIYKFFNTRKCTPDLTELFHGIDRSRLKRTSSAIWKTPPRISMMETEFVEQKLS